MSTLLELLVVGLGLGSVLAVLSLGLAISYWPSRQLHFAYGAVYLSGSYAMWWLAEDQGLPLLLGFLVGLGVSVALCLLCYFAFYRPLADELTVFLTSFALAIVIQYTIQILFSPDPVRLETPGLFEGTALTIGSVTVSKFVLIEIAVCLAVWTAVELFLRRSRVGTGLRALASDEFLTETVGIQTRRLQAGAYALGAVLASVGAFFLAFDFGLTPGGSTTILFFAINAVLVGGTASMTGAALAGLLLGVLVSLATWQVPSQWQVAVAFVVIVVLLLVRPRGLLPRGV